MTIQFVDIYYPNVFKRYSSKFNIFRDLYENDLAGIEIRGIDFKLAQKIKGIILNNKEICYNTGKKGDTFSENNFLLPPELATYNLQLATNE